ncbi:MAG: hypothetical protein HGA54_06055 [Actinobacteria bacterium]|nr:hypothetical protein [Actinomycetota bacterium]
MNEALSSTHKPKLSQKTISSMNPSGLYGSVYEDPRGTRVYRASEFFGLIVGMILLVVGGFWITGKIGAATETPESVLALSEPIEKNMPILINLIAYDDATISTQFSELNTMYQASANSRGMEVVRITEGLTVDDLASYYVNGFSSLNLEQISTFLHGAWFFTTDRGYATTMKVKYADFISGSLTGAIETAIVQQGFNIDGATVLASGIDENENTYQYGTVPYSDGFLYWRIATCPITEVYMVDGLPDSGVYVGVTLSTKELMTITTETPGT